MDLAANKAITIATAVFITIIITSGVLFSIGQMQSIYSQVYETDINIQNRFGEFESFDNTEKTGIDVMNVSKKYRDSDLVNIYILGSSEKLNTSAGINRLPSRLGTNPGEVLYKSTVKDVNGRITIEFTKK